MDEKQSSQSEPFPAFTCETDSYFLPFPFVLLPYNSKIPASVLDAAVAQVLSASNDPKTKRRFLESIELQIGLKNLDPAVCDPFSSNNAIAATNKLLTKDCFRCLIFSTRFYNPLFALRHLKTTLDMDYP